MPSGTVPWPSLRRSASPNSRSKSVASEATVKMAYPSSVTPGLTFSRKMSRSSGM